MTILEGALLLSNLVMTIFFCKAQFKTEDLQEEIHAKNFWFEKLRDFTFSEAIFSDSKGRSQGDYNSNEVAKKWEVWHNLALKYSKESRRSLKRRSK